MAFLTAGTIAAIGAIGGIGASIYQADRQRRAQNEAIDSQRRAQREAALQAQAQQQKSYALTQEQNALNEQLARDQMEAEQRLANPPGALEQEVNTSLMGQINSDAENRKRKKALTSKKTMTSGGGFLGGMGLESSIGTMAQRKELIGQ
jgi:uncharacterized protein HemX